MPMVPGDDRSSAVDAAREFPADRSSHYWDPERRIGQLLTSHHFMQHVDDLRRAVNDSPEFVELVDSWRASPSLAPPAWDCALFFPAGVGWTEPFPRASAWTKQFEFWGDGDGEPAGGMFWRSSAPATLIQSKWESEMTSGMRAVAGP